MPGRPGGKKERETNLLLGKTTKAELKANGKEPDPSDGSESAEVVEVPPVPEFEPKVEGGRGASKEFMAAITARRLAMGKTDPSKKGGRPRTKFSKAELEQRAIERMTPVALKLLETQLKDEKLTPRERREVAKLVLEYKLGKPTQKIEQKVDQRISAIRFETAAFMGIPDADLELGEGDVTEE